MLLLQNYRRDSYDVVWQLLRTWLMFQCLLTVARRKPPMPTHCCCAIMAVTRTMRFVSCCSVGRDFNAWALVRILTCPCPQVMSNQLIATEESRS